METTDKKIIIYDDTCPLCVWYTGQFVNNGLLETDGRMSFEELTNHPEYAKQLNWPQSKHEIPLIDSKSGQTIYGLDSLIFIIDQRFPFLKPIMTFTPFYAFFKFLYKIVSYNRRVIVAAPEPDATSTYDCAPDFNWFYRLLFILFALLVTLVVGNHLQEVLLSTKSFMDILPANGLFYAFLTFLLVHFVLSYPLDKQQKATLFGHLSVILLIGSLILTPFLLLFHFWNGAWYLLLTGGVIAIGLMIKEYLRRFKINVNVSF